MPGIIGALEQASGTPLSILTKGTLLRRTAVDRRGRPNAPVVGGGRYRWRPELHRDVESAPNIAGAAGAHYRNRRRLDWSRDGRAKAPQLTDPASTDQLVGPPAQAPPV